MDDAIPKNYWDSLPSQEFLTENGQIGDCWACCIAAVLCTPRSVVPHFLEKNDHQVGYVDADTQSWLAERGFVMAHFRGGELSFHRYQKDKNVVLPAVIACGPSPRSAKMGRHHAVVYVGHEMVYDPHPSKAGLTFISDHYLIFKPLTYEFSQKADHE